MIHCKFDAQEILNQDFFHYQEQCRMDVAYNSILYYLSSLTVAHYVFGTSKLFLELRLHLQWCFLLFH